MKPYHIIFAVSGFLLLSCNDQKEEPKTTDPASPEVVLGQEGDPSSVEEKILIKERSAGEFKIGAPIPVSLGNYTIIREEQVRTTEEGPTEETVFTVKKGNDEVLKILPATDPNTGESTEDIGEMQITSEKFRTEEGIGVNSTLEEFIEAYPQYKIWYTYVSDMYVVEAEEVEAQFLLNGDDFTGEMDVTSAMTPLEKEDFKEGARIKMVRIIR